MRLSSHPLLPKAAVLYIFNFLLITAGFSQVNNPLINSGELIKQGTALHDKGKYAEAIALYKQIPRSDTNYSNALYEISLSAYSNNQLEESKKYAELGLKLFPDRKDEFYLQIANALDNLEKPQEALDIYQKILKLYPLQYNLYFNEGIALREMKRIEDSKAAFQKCLMINSLHPSSHFFLGKTYMEEGKLVPAMLAFQTYLLVAPSGKYAKNVVQYLNDISKGTDEVLKYTKVKGSSSSPGFDLIQQIVLSKIALDKQYKLNTKLEDVIVRQIQVVLEKLEYNKNDKSFPMQFYVPFYTKVVTDKMFEPMVYEMFSGLNIAAIDTWNKKHKSEIDNFITDASAYFTNLKTTQVLDVEERKNVKTKYLYIDGKLVGRGSYLNEEKQLPTGTWEMFYNNTSLKTTGSFDGEGLRTGEWVFYHQDGSLQEKVTYLKGKQNGPAMGWFTNGNKSYKESYIDDQAEGFESIYYFNGNLKSESNYKSGKREGIVKQYFTTGILRTVANYKNDKREGITTTYYKNGVVESTWGYVEDLGQGISKSYSKNGKLIQEGNTIDSKKDGLWTTWFENGKLKEKVTYIKGDITGEYFQYHENEVVSQKGSYYKGKADGKVEDHDEDGKLYSDYVYDKGKLKEVNFYDKAGKVFSTTGTRRGAATITYFDPLGVKLSEGYFNKEGNRDGVFTYYFPSGKISQVENYKNGDLEGNLTSYYSTGSRKSENTYIHNLLDGYAKSYYPDSKIKYEGWYKEGQKQGAHLNYDPLGSLISRENYLNDELNNYTEYFYPGGIPDYESKYVNGWIDAVTQFDSSGKVMAENNLKNGNGPMIFKHYSGKNMVESSYKNYSHDGIYSILYFDGSKESVRYYKNEDYDSIYRAWYFGGTLKVDGRYKNGEKVGIWKYYYENGQLSEEESYINGRLNGEDKFYNRTDKMLDKVLTDNDDELDGPYRLYGENNQLAVQINYKKGLIKSYTYEDKGGKLVPPVVLATRSGKIKSFYPNGNQSAEIDVADGGTNGVRKIYFTSGKIYVDGTRRDDFDNGVKKIYYPNGNINVEQDYLDGNLHGIVKTYFPSGKLQLEQHYYNGQLHGKVIYFDEQGKVKQTSNYYYNVLLNVK